MIRLRTERAKTIREERVFDVGIFGFDTVISMSDIRIMIEMVLLFAVVGLAINEGGKLALEQVKMISYYERTPVYIPEYGGYVVCDLGVEGRRLYWNCPLVNYTPPLPWETNPFLNPNQTFINNQ